MRIASLLLSLAVVVATACASRGRPQIQPQTVVPPGSDSIAVAVRPVDWWLESASADNFTDRKLYVGSVWQNVSDHPVTLSVRYDVYTEDGRQFQGCDGHAEFVRPRGKAWVFCEVQVGVLRAPRLSLQIASALTSVTAELPPVQRTLNDEARIEDSGLRRTRGTGADELVPWVRVRTPDKAASARALFRLYDRDSVQVGVSISGSYSIPRGVLLLVTGEPADSTPHHFGTVDRWDVEWLVQP